MAAKSSWFSIHKIKKLLGSPAGADIATDIATVDTVVDSILADTVVIGTPAGASVSVDVASIQTDTTVLKTYHAVPTKDATTDTYLRDVTGKKDDTAQTTVGTTRTIIAYVKGILNAIAALNNVSSANVTTACTSSLNTYDPPTRGELTTDKDSIIAEINANETKIDAILADTVVIGSPAGADIATDIATVDTVVDSILADTVVIGTPVGASLAADVATVDTVVDAILADTVALELDSGKSDVAKMVSATENTNTYSNVINITDKGVLTGIAQQCIAYTASNYFLVKIVIDTVTVFDGNFMIFNASSNSNSLSFNHRFDTSLQIQHKVAANSQGTVMTHVSYTTD